MALAAALLLAVPRGVSAENPPYPRPSPGAPDRKPVPPRSELVQAWQKRQDAIKTARFVWTEQHTVPRGWIPNPRFPERERTAIPALIKDRSYSVSKTLTVDHEQLRYTFELDRNADPILGPARNLGYVSV